MYMKGSLESAPSSFKQKAQTFPASGVSQCTSGCSFRTQAPRSVFTDRTAKRPAWPSWRRQRWCTPSQAVYFAKLSVMCRDAGFGFEAVHPTDIPIWIDCFWAAEGATGPEGGARGSGMVDTERFAKSSKSSCTAHRVCKHRCDVMFNAVLPYLFCFAAWSPGLSVCRATIADLQISRAK